MDPVTTTEIGWLIELSSSVSEGVPTYWFGENSWTTAAIDAVRFCRSTDAERVARSLDYEVRITEHMWPRVETVKP